MINDLEQLAWIVSQCALVEGVDHYRVGTYTDQDDQPTGAWYVQHYYLRQDSVTGLQQFGYGRKWHVSNHASKSEVVLTCLKAAITNGEHEIREKFTYRGRPVFQPHQDVDVLWETCVHSDARPLPPDADDVMRGAILG